MSLMLCKFKQMFGKMLRNQQLKLENKHNMDYDKIFINLLFDLKLSIISYKFLLKGNSIFFKHTHLIKSIGDFLLIMRVHNHH